MFFGKRLRTTAACLLLGIVPFFYSGVSRADNFKVLPNPISITREPETSGLFSKFKKEFNQNLLNDSRLLEERDRLHNEYLFGPENYFLEYPVQDEVLTAFFNSGSKVFFDHTPFGRDIKSFAEVVEPYTKVELFQDNEGLKVSSPFNVNTPRNGEESFNFSFGSSFYIANGKPSFAPTLELAYGNDGGCIFVNKLFYDYYNDEIGFSCGREEKVARLEKMIGSERLKKSKGSFGFSFFGARGHEDLGYVIRYSLDF
jgi:hypothetical protein